eukprot:jgi/Tetstr1/425230/TSEL_015690.t2
MASLSPRLPGGGRIRGAARARYSSWLFGSGLAGSLLLLFLLARRQGDSPEPAPSAAGTAGVASVAVGDASAEDEQQPVQDLYQIAAARQADDVAGQQQGMPDDEDGEPQEEEPLQQGRPHGPCDREGWEGAFMVAPLPEVNPADRSTREWWWGGIVALGHQQPLGSVGATLAWELDLHQTVYNQNNPLLVSSEGRYLWLEYPRKLFALEDGTICVAGPWDRGEEPGSAASTVVLGEGHGSLAGALRAASAAHFPPTGRLPDELLFSAPQYNLWIECNYYPTQEKVLAYARKVLEVGMSPGVLMIDTNWAMYYGSNQFDASRFPDPKQMIAELHSLGFKVMLWISPFISPDSPVFRYARRKKYLIKNHWGGVGIPEWWDGHSALLDARNPKARPSPPIPPPLSITNILSLYLLHFLYLAPSSPTPSGGWLAEVTGMVLGGSAEVHAMEHTQAFGTIGLAYNLSEYRACYKLAGTHLVQRLSDKSHTWNNHGLASLLPNGMLMGLVGYAFSCPDMIGGGQYTDFYDMGTLEPNFDHFDQELFVRYAQASAMFPMMQFSLAPWRMLDAVHLEAVVDAAALHGQVAQRILQLAQQAAQTGEPIIRTMEYVFPHLGYAQVRDQFLLGDRLLVAPILVKGHSSRQVRIPPGTWVGQGGAREEDKLTGPTDVWVDGVGRIGSPMTDLMYFIKVDG